MLVLKLAVDVDGLARAGSLVIADRKGSPDNGDWVVSELPDGLYCQRWRLGVSYWAIVVRVLP